MLGEATGFALVLQVFAGNAFTQLGAAQVAVGVHQFGDQADLQLLQVGLGDAYLGIAGLYLALDAAEQVELPGHVQAQVVAIDIHPLLAEARLLRLADLGAGAAGDGGQLVVGRIVAQRAGGLEAGEGHAQLAVALQRLLHQAAQGRIVELPPPGRLEARAVVAGGGARGEAGRGGLRRLVVGTDGAGAQHEGGRQGEQGGDQGFHACTSTAMECALRAWRFSTKARIST
ncbi:hypothetical protein D3C85_410340 [compost metagenome]